MVNGRYDFVFPTDTSQIPLFRLLGTPAAEKRHVLLDAAHELAGRRRVEIAREMLDWLDRYLGPVQH